MPIVLMRWFANRTFIGLRTQIRREMNMRIKHMTLALAGCLACLAGCEAGRGYGRLKVPEYHYVYAAKDWQDQNGDLEAQHWEFLDKRETFNTEEDFVVVYNLFNEYAGGFPLELRVTGPKGEVVLTDAHHCLFRSAMHSSGLPAA